MKRLILFELIIIFLATTFESDSPPGWFQQTLPVNDQVNDIFFLDSSNGWVVTLGKTSPPDTGYIMRTTNGGNDWSVQYSMTRDFNSIQFVDLNTGYAGGGSGNGTRFLYKTTNGGINWVQIMGSLGVGGRIQDMNFINMDTGWICDDNSFDGSLQRTTNGGISWDTQLTLSGSDRPRKVFFINKDTGWVGTSGIPSKSYRTINSGNNWTLMDSIGIVDIYFFNNQIGIKTTGGDFFKTTDSGSNWFLTSTLDGGKLSFGSDSVGWSGINNLFINKTSNNGNSWFQQQTTIGTSSVSATDYLKAWAGQNGIIHTTDGGGPPVGIEQISNEIPSEYKLLQNYPNPFNPVTFIKYQIINTKYVRLVIYDIQGREITELVNQKQTAGIYEVDWKATSYSSGIYFYSLIVDGKLIDTRRMVLIK